MPSIGIEWVSVYHGRATNLYYPKEQAEGFYHTLPGAQRQFNLGNSAAWDAHFEEHPGPGLVGGGDTAAVETVDLVYFSGHGSPEGLLFGVDDQDDGLARAGQIRWGDAGLRWIVLDACEVLRDDGSGAVTETWGFSVFAGLHQILGFHSMSTDEPFRGEWFAQNLAEGMTMRQAWRKACQETEDQTGAAWAILWAAAGDDSTYNDHWFGAGEVHADPTDPQHIYHRKGGC